MAFNITNKDAMSKQKCIEHSKIPLKKQLLIYTNLYFQHCHMFQK